MEGRGEAEVLVLVAGAEAIDLAGDDVAERAVGIALLRKGRAGAVGVALIFGGERGEWIGETALDVLEVIVADGGFGFEVFGDLEVGAGLDGVEPFVVAFEFGGLDGAEVEVGIEDRECACGEEWFDVGLGGGFELDGEPVEADFVGPDVGGGEERVVEAA